MILYRYIVKIQTTCPLSDEQLAVYTDKLEDIDILAGINAVIERADSKLKTDDILITCDEG